MLCSHLLSENTASVFTETSEDMMQVPGGCEEPGADGKAAGEAGIHHSIDQPQLLNQSETFQAKFSLTKAC